MPMYGLGRPANRSIAKRRKKAKSALAARTIPDQLSQLRKLRLKGRGCAGAGASGIAAMIYRRLKKLSSTQRTDYRSKKQHRHQVGAQERRFTARLQRSSCKLYRLIFSGNEHRLPMPLRPHRTASL
jgi:hypothetical protein